MDDFKVKQLTIVRDKVESAEKALLNYELSDDKKVEISAVALSNAIPILNALIRIEQGNK